ncbi:glutenin, high molecular weight subunit DY10 isoform X2 [Drosophila mauritiana]|uniref:Glutenin, high molecular weight subunit DY10 isoform X2 n=1 Tax=Drosophila mauritiana TaxID=7226 RepID=A0A6P8JDH4_DROMA|nr:glutenin, high molecular weight subunit DY10 isoform X2 [Drosophila mauritiana]
MFFQLLSVRLAVSLILLISGQWTSARPQNPYYVENGGHGYPHHHRHHGHHGYGSQYGPGSNGPPPFAFGRFPPPPSYYPDSQSTGGRPPFYPNGGAVQGQPGSPFHQHEGGFHRGQQENPYPVGDFNRGHPGLQQPGGDFNRGQPGFRQPGNEFYRPQPSGRAPGHQQPGSSEELPTYPGGLGGDANTLQPRPGQNPGGFEQPNENEGGFQQPGQNNGGFRQPNQNFGGFRQPGQSTGGFQQPGQSTGGFRQPGQSTGGFQQPGQSIGGFQQPGQSTGGFRQPGQSTGGFQQPGQSIGGFQQPGQSTGGFQQPGQNSGEFQQPGLNQGRKPGTSNNSIQPRPGIPDEDFSDYNFQSPKTLQPRPGQDHETGGSGGAQTIQPIPGQSSVIQPIPGRGQSSDNVGQNIKDLFNTQDFLSPELSTAPGANRDPKSDAEEASPESVNQRSLFNLDPKCAEGLKVMAGRCRKEA